MATGIRIKLPKSKTVTKDGKIAAKTVTLSRPAEYARKTRKSWRAAK